MAVGVSWMGWRRPAAPHGQQRRGCRGRTPERSRDVVVGRETFDVQGDENWLCGGLDCFLSVAGGLGCAKGLRRPHCGCSGGPTSRNGGFSPQLADDMAPIRVAGIGYVQHAMRRCIESPNLISIFD